MVWSSEVCNLPQPQNHHPDSFLRVKMTQNPAGHTAEKKTRAQFDSLDGVPVHQRSMGKKKKKKGSGFSIEGIRSIVLIFSFHKSNTEQFLCWAEYVDKYVIIY